MIFADIIEASKSFIISCNKSVMLASSNLDKAAKMVMRGGV